MPSGRKHARRPGCAPQSQRECLYVSGGCRADARTCVDRRFLLFARWLTTTPWTSDRRRLLALHTDASSDHAAAISRSTSVSACRDSPEACEPHRSTLRPRSSPPCGDDPPPVGAVVVARGASSRTRSGAFSGTRALRVCTGVGARPRSRLSTGESNNEISERASSCVST